MQDRNAKNTINTTLSPLCMQPFSAESDRAKKCTRAIGMFIAPDMFPFSVVERIGGFSTWGKCSSNVTKFVLKHPFQEIGSTRST
jgi:hypothetical protein